VDGAVPAGGALIRRPLLAAAAALLLAACADPLQFRGDRPEPSPESERGSDLGRTFEDAVLVFPPAGGGRPAVVRFADAATRGLAAAAPPGGYPVVLYLHGCTGFGGTAALEEMARAGFLVVAPDSFARRFRPPQCTPSTLSGGRNIYVFDFRLTEIAYAVDRLRGLAWADADRLLLLGESEGGLAAALYRGDDFRGRAILQWTCQGAPYVRGLAAPPGEPVLAIVRGGDPWYDPARTPGQRGDCGSFLAGRPASESLVLGTDARHAVLDDPEVVRRLIGFFRAALAR